MLRVGLIGHGAIARTVVQALYASDQKTDVSVIGTLMRPGHGAPGCNCPIFDRLPDLLALRPDIIAETAGQDAVAEHGAAVLMGGCDLLITSVGALANEAVIDSLRDAACRAGHRVLLPSGAIGGIDAIAAMRMAGLSTVTYRSRKPPAAWKGSLAEEMLPLDSLSRAETFYRGSARDAARKFPKNANVAATVALAGLGLDRTKVELIADPDVICNIHEVEAEGASGRVSFRLEGVPLPDNPRSSMLTAYSVARALLNIHAAVPI